MGWLDHTGALTLAFSHWCLVHCVHHQTHLETNGIPHVSTPNAATKSTQSTVLPTTHVDFDQHVVPCHPPDPCDVDQVFDWGELYRRVFDQNLLWGCGGCRGCPAEPL